MSVKYFDKTQGKWVIFPGSIGAPGRSAYELAAQQGYKGTLDEWLESLKGENGKDAYTIAVEGGYKGTEEEFNNALVVAPIAVDKINNADAVPTKDSTNLVLSGGVKDAIDSLSTDIEADLETINNNITDINSSITNIINTEISTQIKNSIVDNLTSTDTEKSLSAKQGKILKDLIDNLVNLQITVVDNLPSVGESNIIYLVSKSGTGNDVHDEYVYVNDSWEQIGTTDIDLSDYYNKPQVDTIIEGLNNKISNNTSSINNIITNGSITPENLTIRINGENVFGPWNGSSEGTADIIVPKSLSDLNVTATDITNILGYIPADSASAGMGDVSGPNGATDSNFVAFDSTDGKHIKDSGYNAGSFAVKNHTHTVSQITDISDNYLPLSGGTMSGSIIPEAGKSYTLGNSNYKWDWTYTNHITCSSVFFGNAGQIGNDTKPCKLIYLSGDGGVSEGIRIDNVSINTDVLKALDSSGDGTKFLSDDGTYKSVEAGSYTLPVASDTTLGGIKTGYQESNGAEMAIYLTPDNKAYTYLKSSAIIAALNFTPANSEDIPEIPDTLPNPNAINIVAGGSTTSYTGSSVSNINLDNIFAKKLGTAALPGQPGIFYNTTDTTLNVDQIYVTEDNPDAIIVVPSNVTVSFTGYQKMEGLDDLSGGSYKCYCITYISVGLALVNGAIYG